MWHITPDMYLMGRIKIEDLTAEQATNMYLLLPKINELIDRYDKPIKLNSGYRSEADQMRINPRAPKSRHTICAAVDLGDKEHNFRYWILSHINYLEELGLYMEDPAHCPTWVHLQCIAPHSGYRIFIP